MAFDIEFAGIRSQYRKGVNDALNAIREGSIQEEDLDKLHNFCMVALMLMHKVNLATWRNAERAAETANLLQEALILTTPKAENRDEQPENTASAFDFERGNETVLDDPETVEPLTNLYRTIDRRGGS